MRTLAIDENNDLRRGASGNLELLNGVQAIAQNCRTAVQAQRGEMQFAADTGMPTFATAWDRYSPEQFEAAARAVLLRVPGVVSVDEFAIERRGGVLAYTATILSLIHI